MQIDRNIEFNNCYQIKSWNILIQTDVYNVQVCIRKYKNILRTLMAIFFMCGSVLHLILKEYFKYGENGADFNLQKLE